MKFFQDNTSNMSGPLIRGDATGKNGYVCFVNTNIINLKYLNNSTLPTSFSNASITMPMNNWIWIRFRVTGNSSPVLSARAWIDGNSEPGSWQVTFTDTNNHFTSAGQYGIWADASVTDGVESFSVNDTLVGGGAVHLLSSDGMGGVFS